MYKLFRNSLLWIKMCFTCKSPTHEEAKYEDVGSHGTLLHFSLLKVALKLSDGRMCFSLKLMLNTKTSIREIDYFHCLT